MAIFAFFWSSKCERSITGSYVFPLFAIFRALCYLHFYCISTAFAAGEKKTENVEIRLLLFKRPPRNIHTVEKSVKNKCLRNLFSPVKNLKSFSRELDARRSQSRERKINFGSPFSIGIIGKYCSSCC